MSITKKDLEQCFKDARYTDSLFIGVKISTRGSISDEVIINSSENFDNKLEYYMKSYNDDLVLKTYDGISIVGICYGNSFDDIEVYFEEEVEGGL